MLPQPQVAGKALRGRVKAAMNTLTACQSIIHQYASQSTQHFVHSADWSPSWPLDPEFQDVLATYVEPQQDLAQWEPLLNQAEEVLSSRTLWLPEQGSTFWNAVQHLVPWDLRR
eukprot:2252265-Amphidinium_carterae.1